MKVVKFGFFSRVEVEINDEGIIDDAATSVFLRGHCHSFAIALHKETGWPIVGFETEADRKANLGPCHCAVYSPELDDYIDIEGKGAKTRMEFQEPAVQVIPLKVEDFGNLKSYMPPRPEVGAPYAKTVLTNLGCLIPYNTEESNGSHNQSDSR